MVHQRVSIWIPRLVWVPAETTPRTAKMALQNLTLLRQPAIGVDHIEFRPEHVHRGVWILMIRDQQKVSRRKTEPPGRQRKFLDNDEQTLTFANDLDFARRCCFELGGMRAQDIDRVHGKLTLTERPVARNHPKEIAVFQVNGLAGQDYLTPGGIALALKT
jgi:hypothetical protein